MFYVITTHAIYKGKTVKDVNNQIKGTLDMDEFKQVGPDMIINLTEKDLDFVQDKRKLSTIMFGNFFKKDNTPKILTIINLIFTFLIMVRVMG